MEKLYYSISEVSEMLGESVSLVRFWSNTFEKYIKPHRTAKGNRQYTLADIEVLRQIHMLVKTEGLTLTGAAARLDASRASVSGKMKVLDSLKEIRAQLVEIRKTL